ncbi:unnamed protein product [Rotaria sp. Silwood1]|nr:unnamed protein product [Rotaria sp. Silwood1]
MGIFEHFSMIDPCRFFHFIQVVVSCLKVQKKNKSQKISRSDEISIIETYHPINKDYDHMKIEELKTSHASNDNIDEEMDIEHNNDEIISSDFDPNAIIQRFLFIFFAFIINYKFYLSID